MKLITKNLRGYLENGDEYRIIFTDTPCKITKRRIITIIKEVYNDFLDNYFLDDVVCGNYENKEDYKEEFKNTLLRAEDQFGIQLIKSTMKIAV